MRARTRCTTDSNTEWESCECPAASSTPGIPKRVEPCAIVYGTDAAPGEFFYEGIDTFASIFGPNGNIDHTPDGNDWTQVPSNPKPTNLNPNV